MKRFVVRVPREHQFYFVVDAENSREARFEAAKYLISQVLKDRVPLDISDQGEVAACQMCATSFFPEDLTDLDGKRVCTNCADIERNGVPDFW